MDGSSMPYTKITQDKYIYFLIQNSNFITSLQNGLYRQLTDYGVNLKSDRSRWKDKFNNQEYSDLIQFLKKTEKKIISDEKQKKFEALFDRILPFSTVKEMKDELNEEVFEKLLKEKNPPKEKLEYTPVEHKTEISYLVAPSVKTIKRDSRHSSDLIEILHEKGHIALHCTPSPSYFHDKLEDNRIIGNLREDGGPPKAIGYALYPVISTTLLPSYLTPTGQGLFGQFFVGINLEKSKIKGYFPADADSQYGIHSKTKRMTYQIGFSLHHGKEYKEWKNWDNLSHEKRLTLLDNLNLKENNIRRNMNELVAKVNADSLLFLGCTADYVNANPAALFDLIYHQNELRKKTGAIFPIVIYHSDTQKIQLNVLEQTIEPNSFLKLDTERLLQYLSKHFSKGVPNSRVGGVFCETQLPQPHFQLSDFYKLMNYSLDEMKQPILPTLEAQLREEREKRQLEAAKVKEALTLLEKVFILYNFEDHVLGIHKEGIKKASPSDHYMEINQSNLHNFIHKTYFADEKLSSEEIKLLPKFIYLTKIYNLQFRLSIYDELLQKPVETTLLNHEKLKDDLEWFKTLKTNDFYLDILKDKQKKIKKESNESRHYFNYASLGACMSGARGNLARQRLLTHLDRPAFARRTKRDTFFYSGLVSRKYGHRGVVNLLPRNLPISSKKRKF
jgi:hypothetical protein